MQGGRPLRARSGSTLEIASRRVASSLPETPSRCGKGRRGVRARMRAPPSIDPDSLELVHEWCAYAHVSLSANEEYSRGLLEIGRCASVGAFWRLHNHTPAVSRIFDDQHIAVVQGRHVEGFGLFRSTSRPEWEHASQKGGFVLHARQTLTAEVAERAWIDLRLAAVCGDAFGDLINGVRLVSKAATRGQRRTFKFEVWCPPTSERAEVSAHLAQIHPRASYECDADARRRFKPGTSASTRGAPPTPLPRESPCSTAGASETPKASQPWPRRASLGCKSGPPRPP